MSRIFGDKMAVPNVWKKKFVFWGGGGRVGGYRVLGNIAHYFYLKRSNLFQEKNISNFAT